MFQPNELLDIKQASVWATEHIGKTVTPSNIDFDIFLVANDKYNLYPHLN